MDSRALERQLSYEHELTVIRRMEVLGILTRQEAENAIAELTAECMPPIPSIRLDCSGEVERPC